MEGGATTVENTPEIALLKRAELVVLGPVSNLLSSVLEGVLKDEIHLVLDGANKVLLFFFYLDEGEEMVIFYLSPALEEGLQPFEVGLVGTADNPHQVVLVVGFASEQGISIVFKFEYFEVFFNLLL